VAQDGPGTDRAEQNRGTEQDGTGQDRTKQDRTGQDGTEQDRTEQEARKKKCPSSMPCCRLEMNLSFAEAVLKEHTTSNSEESALFEVVC
jgi:hypothetical protein